VNRDPRPTSTDHDTDPPPPPPPPGATAAADRSLLATPTRQSPVAVVFIAIRFIRNLGMVNLGVAMFFLISGRLSGALLVLGAVVAAVGLVFTLLAWWRFVFTVDGRELLVSKGVVAHERLTIPLDRVQSVSINQKFLHRLIGLVSVSVDTAGSSAAELEIYAVDRRRAEALQRLAAGQYRNRAGSPGDRDTSPGPGGPPSATATGPEETLIARTPVELVRIGVARWPWAGLVALAPLVALAGEYADRLLVDTVEQRVLADRLPSDFGTGAVVALAAIGVGLAVLAALVGTLLQMVRTLVTDWDLRLTRTATGFRRTAGLLSTTSKASTVNRIQAVRTDETPIERLLHIRRLTLPTIGEGDLAVAGLTAEELTRIRDEVFGRTLEPALERRISPQFVFLAVRNQALVAVPVVALLAVAWSPWCLVGLAVVPIRLLTSRRQWRLRRWGLSGDRVAERYELVDRHTADQELIKTQTVTVRRSFFERRRGLATVRIGTAEGHLAVPLIPLAEAEAVRDLTLYRVESDRRAWM
jgi:putative membrane protein